MLCLSLPALLLGALLWLRPSVDFSNYFASHMDFYYGALCCIACPFSSLPATPPRRHPGKGEGYTELEDVEDYDALLVPIVLSGAERPSLPCPALS